MRTCLLLIVVLLFIPAWAAGLAGEQDPAAGRWGITTKKNLENLPSLPIEKKATANKTDEGIAPSHAPVKNGHADSLGDKPGAEKQFPSSSVNPKPDSSAGRNGSDNAVETPAAPTKESAHPSKNSSSAIEWASENQEEICRSHLSDLRKLFLETRHLSIQGASCETAASASRFLQSIDQCEKDCPTRFLEENGYSKRIVRNIRYLEKLGHDRCDGQLSTNQSE